MISNVLHFITPLYILYYHFCCLFTMPFVLLFAISCECLKYCNVRVFLHYIYMRWFTIPIVSAMLWPLCKRSEVTVVNRLVRPIRSFVLHYILKVLENAWPNASVDCSKRQESVNIS